MHKSKIVTNKRYKDINPEVCGSEACESGHFYGPAVRDYWLLHFVVSGKGKFRTAGREYQLGKNDVFIIRPHEITYYEADANDPWEYVWIGFFSTIILPRILLENDVLYAPFLSNIFLEAVKADDISGGRKGFESFLCAKIWEMLSRLEDEENYTPKQTDRYIRSAIDIMEAEYHSGITVEELSERLHLNRSYFSTLFTHAVGISPKKYLDSLRMKRAAELLSERGLNVSVTATSVGFSDIFVFSRAFKNYYGVSPKEFIAKK